MKYFLLFVFLVFYSSGIFAQPGCPSINAGTDQAICASQCATLSSTYLATGATTSYTVSSIAYAPPYSYAAGTPLLVNIDDTWSGVLNIPFTFCFFGTAYTQLVAGSNGCVTFDLGEANTSCAWSFSASCPNSGIISGSLGPYILAPYHDIDPAVTGDMYYNTYGSYPCRTFVVSWNQIAMFSCNSLIATHMVVMYESTNVIEVYIQNKPTCTSWNSGNAVIGIQNAAGTVGYVPPGRNTGQWTTSNEAWRFTPSGTSNYAVSWWQGATQIASGTSTSVCPASTTAYTAQIVYTNCNSAQVTVTDAMNVTVNPGTTPTFTALGPYCMGATPGTLPTTSNNSITGTWSPSAISTAAVGTTTYTFTPTVGQCASPTTMNVTVTAANVTPTFTPLGPYCVGASPGTLPTTSTNSITGSWSPSAISTATAGTSTYTFTPTAGQCAVPATMNVTVNSAPTADAGLPQTICPTNSATLTATGGGTYLWDNSSTLQSITVTPVSTTSYTVTVTLSGCTASDNVTVTVNSTITADAGSPQTICSGQPATLTASGGSTYAWSNGGSTASISVSPASTTTYTVTVSSGGCTGTDNVQVTVNPVPTADAGLPQSICMGQSATLSATGGGTYLWDNGSALQSITVNPGATTTFTVTVTSSGCSASDNVTVTVNPIPAADAGLPQTICPGYSATLTATGGSSYSWSNGMNTASITVSPATITTYTVTVSDLGCSSTDNVTVTVSSGIIADAGLPQAICSGENAVLSASGGTTYQWSTSETTQSITVTPVTTTTYTVTASSGGCSGTDNVTVTVNTTPTANAGTDQIICSGQSANLTAFGGGTYEWSNGSFNQSTNVAPAATSMYTVTVTSTEGCTDTDDVQVTVNSLPVVSAGADQAICIGFSANITASGGTTYSWSSGDNTSTISVSPASTTTYTVTVTDANGCTNTDEMILTVNMSPVADAGTDQSICMGSSASLNASGGTTYQWDPAAGLTSTTISNPSASPTTTTTYTVTVSSGVGCSATDDVTITVYPIPTSDFNNITPICVAGYSDITYTGTGSSGASYSWDFDGGTVLSGTGQGPYQVSWASASSYDISLTVSENGCTSPVTTHTQVVGQISATITVTDSISCYGVSDGSATVTPTGTAPYQYIWSNSQMGQTAQNLSANTLYSVTVTDNYGCTATQSITLSEPSPLSMNFVSQDVMCYGGSTGVASATISGGTPSYQYSWLPLGTAGNVNLVTTLIAGTYTFTTTDAHGCIVDTTFIISQPPLLTYTYITDSVSCYSGNDGSVNITVDGGNSPYAYTWNPSVSTGASATNLSSGTYTVTVTDHNGCVAVSIIPVDQPPQLILGNSGNVSICNGQSTTISSYATGGTGSYVFIWDNGLGDGNSFTVNPTTTTTYTVSVTDENGCTASPQSLTVSVSPPISVIVSATPLSLCYGESTALTATANGGNGNYTYTWGAGIGASSSLINVTPSSTTTYPVTVTDACGSPQGVDSVTITVFPLPQVMFTSDTINGCEPLTVNFTDLSTPAIANWSWNFGDVQSGSNNNSVLQNPSHFYGYAGLYSVTLSVTTTDGCSGSITQQNIIEVYPTPDAYFYHHPEYISILDPNVNFIDLSTDAYTWNWNFGDPAAISDNTSDEQSPSHAYSEPGTYTVTLIISSQYGCIDSVSNDIIVNPEFTFYIPSAFTPDGNGKNDYFHPYGDGFDENSYQLYIFDRWGEMIFSTTNFLDYWDGKVNGGTKIAPQGVYTWVIVVKDLVGDTHNYNGRVTLLRK